MKIALLLLTICTFSSCFFSLDSKKDHQSITVSETDETYYIVADYNKKNDKEVQEALERFASPHELFSDFGSVTYDGSVTLDDKTTFDLKYSPGKLKITLDRKKNSNAAYEKMKKLSKELNEALE